MRKMLTVLLGLFLIAPTVEAQHVKVRTKMGSFSVRAWPAILSASLEFWEPSGNRLLDAEETGILKVTVSNSGRTAAKDVVVKLTSAGSSLGVSFPPLFRLGDLAPNASAVTNFEIAAKENVRTQTIKFFVEMSDTSGVKIKAKSISISTQARLIAKDETPPEIELKEPATLSTRGITIVSDDGKFHTQKSSLKVKGMAKDLNGVAKVIVNGQEAQLSLSSEGTEFVGDALLVLGNNEIEIKAVDKFRNENILKLAVMREPEVWTEQKFPPPNFFKGQRWAVVVGISQYKDLEIPPLRYADKDARAFYELLTRPLDEGGLGIPRPNTRLLVNEQATTTNVREAITDFLKSAIEDDIVLVYFAGHGAPDPDRPKVLYLLTADSELSRLGATAIKMNEIQDALRDYIAAKSVLVFADACHSRGVSRVVAMRGLASPELVNAYLSELGRSRPSTLTFSASDIDQLSQEGERWGEGHGIFTYYLLEGLKGKADSDNDKIVRLGELIFYVNDAVRRDTKARQSPISSGGFDVNLPLTVVVP